MLITNDDGSEVEVFTQEEVDTQKQEALDEKEAENAEELDKLRTDLQEKNDALIKLNDKDKNFANLRKAKEDAEKNLESFKSDIDDKINFAKNEILEGFVKNHYTETLNSLADGDDELKKKLEFHYKRLGDVAGTKEEVALKLKDAYVLATKQEVPDALNSSVLSTGGMGKLNFNSKSNNISPEEKAFALKLGLTDADFKKHG